MGIWERLGTLIKSYVTFEADDKRAWRRDGSRRQTDPDLAAAYEELDDFLGGKGASTGTGADAAAGQRDTKGRTKERTRPIPEKLKQDFVELGLSPEASVEECKEAYKKLLKIHHPDRHAKHEGNLKKATERTARVNEAYERIRIYLQF